MSDPTGNSVAELRTRLALTVKDFSTLFGVFECTVYNWMAKKEDKVSTGGAQHSIFRLLETITEKLNEEDLNRFNDEIRNSIVAGGFLEAMSTLLKYRAKVR